MNPSVASELIVNAASIKARLRCPPNAVPDVPINLKRLPKGFYYIGERPEPIVIPIAAIENAESVQIVVKPRKPTIKSIIAHVAAYYNRTPADIIGRSRLGVVVRPRQVAIYLCREVMPQFYRTSPLMLCPWSMPSLGDKFGRDHTTVLHGYQKIKRLTPIDFDLAWDVAHLEAELMVGVE